MVRLRVVWQHPYQVVGFTQAVAIISVGPKAAVVSVSTSGVSVASTLASMRSLPVVKAPRLPSRRWMSSGLLTRVSIWFDSAWKCWLSC